MEEEEITSFAVKELKVSWKRKKKKRMSPDEPAVWQCFNGDFGGRNPGSVAAVIPGLAALCREDFPWALDDEDVDNICGRGLEGPSVIRAEGGSWGGWGNCRGP